VIFGAVANPQVENLQDINGREALVLGTLAVAVLFFGLWPQPLVDMLQVSVDNLLQHIVQSKVI